MAVEQGDGADGEVENDGKSGKYKQDQTPRGTSNNSNLTNNNSDFQELDSVDTGSQTHETSTTGGSVDDNQTGNSQPPTLHGTSHTTNAISPAPSTTSTISSASSKYAGEAPPPDAPTPTNVTTAASGFRPFHRNSSIQAITDQERLLEIHMKHLEQHESDEMDDDDDDDDDFFDFYDDNNASSDVDDMSLYHDALGKFSWRFILSLCWKFNCHAGRFFSFLLLSMTMPEVNKQIIYIVKVVSKSPML